MSKKIEIDLLDDERKWCRIEDDGELTLIGMYESGKVERELFYIERSRLKQLVYVLQMLCMANDSK